jgi:hypothetical protein
VNGERRCDRADVLSASFRGPPTGPRKARPDDRLRASPESITTTGSMDAGPAPGDASRNDGVRAFRRGGCETGFSFCFARRPPFNGRGAVSPSRDTLNSSLIFEERARASFSSTVTVGLSSPRSSRLTWVRSIPASTASISCESARATRNLRMFRATMAATSFCSGDVTVWASDLHEGQRHRTNFQIPINQVRSAWPIVHGLIVILVLQTGIQTIIYNRKSKPVEALESKRCWDRSDLCQPPRARTR